MLTVVFINLLALLPFLFGRRLSYLFALKVSCLIIFLFLGLRYDYGNDYPGYLDMFQNIVTLNDVDYWSWARQWEYGFLLLNWFLQPVGFFGLIFVVAAFNIYSIYYLIKRFLPAEMYWLAIFIYVFNSELMLVHSSAIRQSIAISIALWGAVQLLKNNYIRFALLVFMAALFHKSAFALFLLPLCNLKYLAMPYSRWIWAGLWIFCLLTVTPSIMSYGFVSSFFNILAQYTHYVQYYVYDGMTGEFHSGLGLLFILVVIFPFCIYSYIDLQEKERFFMNIIFASYCFIPIGVVLLVAMRINMYLSIFQIIAFPLAVYRCRNRDYSKLFIAGYIFLILYGFVGFFQSPVWIEKFTNYKTIFSSPFWM